MSIRAAEELYYDSEATLRLVDNVLAELEVMEPDFAPHHGRGPTLSQQRVAPVSDLDELPDLLRRAYGEIQSGLESLRRSRDVLERTTAEKILHRGDREADSVTEVAATDILDGVDRAIALVDRLDVTEQAPARAELRGALRDELFGVMDGLRFQDITSQQLSYASSVLSEMESRFASLVALFEPVARSRQALVEGTFGG